MNNMNINHNDVIAYQARLAAIKQSKNNNNIKVSKNMQEHEKLKEELLEQLKQTLLTIDSSRMSLPDKIAMANEAENCFKGIIASDTKNMEKKRILIVKKLDSIRNLMQQKLNSEILSPSQKEKIEKYKEKRAKQKRNAIILWIITILLCILTIGILCMFLTKNLAKKQEEKFTDVEYKKQKNILDSATKNNQNALNDNLAKQLLGDNTSTISTINENKGIKEFTITTNGTATYYKYDKITDTLMSKTSISQNYTTIDGGKNYLAKYFAGEGGIVVSNREGIEKIVKVGEDTYTYDYNSTDIVKNNITYKKYPNGEPFFVKSYNSDDKYWTLITLIPPLVSGVAAGLITKEIISPGGNNRKVKRMMEKDEEFQQNKTEMEEQYNNVLENSDNIADNNDVGFEMGDRYARALKNLQKKYNSMTMQNSNNSYAITTSEIEQIANGIE